MKQIRMFIAAALAAMLLFPGVFLDFRSVLFVVFLCIALASAIGLVAINKKG